MFCGTILLDSNNYYVDIEGNLPKRPKHDKLLLTEMCKNQTVSEEGYETLPLSMQKLILVSATPTLPITISELANCQILIVSRSTEVIKVGKKFRLDKHKLIVRDRKIEIWSKI